MSQVATQKKIAFILYHGMGHFNACFYLARQFQQNHEVIFLGVEYFKKHVESQGFNYYALQSVPFGLNLENWVNEIRMKKFIWWQTLKDRWRDSLYHQRETELREFISSYKPDYILLDSMQSTDFIVLHPMMKDTTIHFGLVSTTLPCLLNPNEPSINSLATPNSDSIEKTNRSTRINLWWKNFIQKIKYAGMSDQQIIQRRMKRNKIPRLYVSPYVGLFSPAFQNLPEFIMAPVELNFPGSKILPSQHYLGMMLEKKRNETVDPEFFHQKEMIFKQLAARNTKLIYCSFGTTPLKERNTVLQLLRNIILATKDFTLLVSIQVSEHERALLLKESEHVFIFKALPQLEILTHTDLFITHGGLNSIKESILANVPMLLYLTETRRDQPGNTARVLYHQMGIKGEFTDSVNDIEVHISRLLSGAYKQRLTTITMQKNAALTSQDVLAIMIHTR